MANCDTKVVFTKLALTLEQKERWGDVAPMYTSKFVINSLDLEVPDHIDQIEMIDGFVLIVITIRSSAKTFNLNRNIWCYNEKGEKEWEIMDMFESEEMKNKDTVKYRVEPYTGIWKEEEKIKVSTFGGFTGVLDIKTGKVSNWSWSR